MAQIVNRVGAIPLTKAELDRNFNNLDRYKLTKNSNTVIIPSGTSQQRDQIANTGRLRFNTETNEFEGYYYTGWAPVGARGFTGAAGPVTIGATGPTGASGDAGVKGSVGQTGSPGTGITGPTGPTGATGPSGPAGVNGALGYTGSKGQTGYTGSRGYTGSSLANQVLYSTNYPGVANNNSLTLLTSNSRPGYNNTDTGIMFNSDGSIYVSRNNPSTISPYFYGILYICADTGGEMISYTYGGDTINRVYTDLIYDGSYKTRTIASGSASLTTLDKYSDYRKKENFSINLDNLKHLKQIKFYEFNYIEEHKKHFGFLAHQLQEQWPGVVIGKKDDENMYQNINLLAMDGLLFSAIKELDTKLNNITTKLKEKYGYNI